MQSFRHSRARILFEVFCALAISASCAGAWLQTGASALLPAAFVAALYGLVHAFDMRRPRPTVAVASHPLDFATAPATIIPATPAAVVPPAPAELQLTTENSIDQGEKTEPTAPRPNRARRAKAAPKGTRRRASDRDEDKVTDLAQEAKVAEAAQPEQAAPPEEAKLTEVAPPEEAKVTEPTPLHEARVTKLSPGEDAQIPAPPPSSETAPVPLTPLFEPEPFVRQQRAVFGRKG